MSEDLYYALLWACASVICAVIAIAFVVADGGMA